MVDLQKFVRAENLSLQRIGHIADEAGFAIKTIESLAEFFTGDFSWLGKPRILAGPKGCGKTFTALAAARMVINRGMKPPHFYIYKQHGKVERLPFRNVGEAYVYDDVHYLVEAVVYGRESEETLIQFMEDALEKSKEGKSVLIISEDLPHLYFEKLNIDRLTKLCPIFDYVNLMPIMSFGEWLSLLPCYEIGGDVLGFYITFSTCSKPRFLLRLASEVGDLTFENIIRKAEELAKDTYWEPLLHSAVQDFKEVMGETLDHYQKFVFNRRFLQRLQEMDDRHGFLLQLEKDTAWELKKQQPRLKRIYDDRAVILKYSMNFGFPEKIVMKCAKRIRKKSNNRHLRYYANLFRDFEIYNYASWRASLKKDKKLNLPELVLDWTSGFPPIGKLSAILLQVFSGYAENSTMQTIEEYK
jgi:DNA polymerase III delta prime subunit